MPGQGGQHGGCHYGKEGWVARPQGSCMLRSASLPQATRACVPIPQDAPCLWHKHRLGAQVKIPLPGLRKGSRGPRAPWSVVHLETCPSILDQALVMPLLKRGRVCIPCRGTLCWVGGKAHLARGAAPPWGRRSHGRLEEVERMGAGAGNSAVQGEDSLVWGCTCLPCCVWGV